MPAMDLEKALDSIEKDGTKDGVADLYALAKEGDANAQFALGQMYSTGTGGVSMYSTVAYMWFHISGMNGNFNATAEKNKLEEERMIPIQIAEAKQLIEGWIERNPRGYLHF